MKKPYLLLPVLMLSLTACGISAIPALRSPAQQDGRVLIQQALGAMLNDSSVMLADDVFISETEIIVERRNLNVVNGRVTGPDVQPMHFRLLKRGDDCLLEHVEAGEVREVPGLACAAAEGG